MCEEALRDRVRETSRLAYEYLVVTGALSARRREVYQQIYQYGPGTSAEILRHILATQADGGVQALTQSRARFTELRDAGVIQELGQVKCRVTGRQAILWDVTSQVTPSPTERPADRSGTRGELLELAGRAVSRLETAAGEHSDLMLHADARALREELRRYHG